MTPAELQDVAVWREVLLDMTYQFAYRGTKGGKAVLSTGGLSSLELAFATLGWPDPVSESDAK